MRKTRNNGLATGQKQCPVSLRAMAVLGSCPEAATYLIPMNAGSPTKAARPIARRGRHALRMNFTFSADALYRHGRLIVIERVILGVFLVLPLLIVAFLFSDELWQDHLRQARDPGTRRVDWRHPLRSLLHRH